MQSTAGKENSTQGVSKGLGQLKAVKNSIGLCAEGVWKFPTGGRILTQPETGQNLLKRVGNYDINYIKRYKLSPKAESHKKEICTNVLAQLQHEICPPESNRPNKIAEP